MIDNKSEETRLLELFSTDEKMAFRYLFDRYYMSLCIYCVQLTDKFEESEDLVQDVLLRFWEKRIFEKISTNLRSYLYTSVRNEALQYLRSKSQLSMEQLSDNEVDIPEEEYDEEELVELKLRLQAALEKLPKQEYLAIQAVALENLKYKEAAEKLGISVNTLKTYLSRAFKSLRKEDNLRFLLFYML